MIAVLFGKILNLNQVDPLLFIGTHLPMIVRLPPLTARFIRCTVVYEPKYSFIFALRTSRS